MRTESSLITALAQQVPTFLQGNALRLQDYLTASVEEHQKCSELDVAEARRAFFQLTQPSAADYLEHPLQLALAGEDCSGWAGIRFLNLDPQTPFVACTLSLDPFKLLQNPAQRELLLKTLAQQFSIFKPHGLTLRLFQEPSPVLAPFQVWNRYWLRDLRQSPPTVLQTPLELKRVTDLDRLDYPRFVAQHQFWRLVNPELAAWVHPAAADEFEESIAQGLCYQAFHEGQPIGLIAGLEADYYGRSGVSVLEFMVYPGFQNQGFGKLIQGLFQAELAQRSDCELIWGTIHADNQASQRTAQACGRCSVEWEVFVPFSFFRKA